MTTLMIQLMFKPSKHLKTDETQYCQRLYNAFSKKNINACLCEETKLNLILCKTNQLTVKLT